MCFILGESSDEDDEQFVLREENEIRYTRLTKPKILRFCNFSKSTHSEDYWREQLYLFAPWRNEKRDIEGVGDYEQRAQELEETILENSKAFYKQRENWESFESNIGSEEFQLEDFGKEDEEPETIETVPVTEGEPETNEYTAEILTSKRQNPVEKFLPPKAVDGAQFRTLMRSLNEGQRKIVLEVLHRIKTGKLPFYLFLSGGAGVGKSHVITAIVQSVLRYVNKLQHYPADSMPVIICAPTGRKFIFKNRFITI